MDKTKWGTLGGHGSSQHLGSVTKYPDLPDCHCC